jgi:dolichol-phosphate mannosyltransferase
LFAATKKAKIKAQLLVLDDESKGTPETERIVANLAKTYDIAIHVRRKSDPGKGLSSAVLLGNCTIESFG